MDGIQPTYNLADRGVYNGGFGSFGDGGGLWIFALLILLFGANGNFFGNGNNGRCATVEDLNNSANFTRLENQVMNNGNRIEQKTDAINYGIANLGYELASQFGNTNSKIDNCCCSIKQEILTNRYENALAIASVNSNITNSKQEILNTIAQNKIEALQGKVQALELQAAVSNVVRYPTAMTYAYNGNPFCGCGNPCTGYANV